MSLLFVNESSATIGMEANRCTIKYGDGMTKAIPVETLEGITIIGRAQITAQCVQECLKRGIPVSYYSTSGNYFGKLQSTGHVNAQRQRKQCALYDTKFSLEFSRKIISAKLKNQEVVLKRYEKSREILVQEPLKMLSICRGKVSRSAFEALIDKKTYKKLLKCLPPYASEEDSIRVYKFFGGNQVTSFGRAAEQDEDDIVVI